MEAGSFQILCSTWQPAELKEQVFLEATAFLLINTSLGFCGVEPVPSLATWLRLGEVTFLCTLSLLLSLEIIGS